MTSLFSSSKWNTSPTAYWTIQYEHQRSGANMQYRFYWKVWLGYSDSYYYNGIRLKLFIDGSQKDITVKAYSKNETGWNYEGTTEWYTVSNKASGTTAFYAQLYDTNTGATKITSSTYQLAVIASQATITGADNFNDEQNPTIYYTNAAGNDVTSLQACISFDGSAANIGYRDVPKTGTSYTFQLTDAERNVLRNGTPANSRKLYFYLRTVVGSNEYFDRVEKELTIVNANPTFAASQVTYKDTNSATVAVTGNNQQIVQNKSVLAVTFTGATAIKGAKIASYSVSVNGVAKALSAAGTIEIGTVNANSDLSLVVTAIDSRGNSTPVYKTVTIIPYAEPSVTPFTNYKSIVCERCDANGTPADEGTFLKLVVQGKWNTLTNEKNTASVKVKATYTGYDSGWVNVPATAIGGGASNNYFKWYDINTKVTGLTLDTTKAYTVTIRCIDSIGAYKDIPYTIPTSDVCLHLRKGGKGAAFGEYSQEANALSVASDWEFKAKGFAVMQNGYFVHSGAGVDGSNGYVKIAEITVKNTYVNTPIRFSVSQRGVRQNDVTFMFNGVDNLDPDIYFFNYEGTEFTAYMGKIAASTWGIYIKKRQAYDHISITEINIPKGLKTWVAIRWCNDLVAESELPEKKTLCVQLYTDYVVEKGTSGIWTYRKWQSGISECWGSQDATPTTMTAFDRVYYFDTEVAFPANLFVNGVYDVQTTVFSKNGGLYWASPYNCSTEKTTVRVMGGDSTVRTSTIWYSIKGKWK